MRRNRFRPLGLALVLGASMISTLTIGLALAQDPPAEPKPAAKAQDPKPKPGKARAKRKGPVAPAVAPPAKGQRPKGADPLAKNAGKADVEPGANANANDNAKAKADPAQPLEWPLHYKLKIGGADGTPLAASYYPARGQADTARAPNAPVVILIHDKGAGRSGKDWEAPIDELKGLSLAGHLQDQGYVVLVPDLRFHGANAPRRDPSAAEWRMMPGDLQALYLFLVDRHNREELNLAKLGVIAVGDSANLAAAWAAMPGAAVSSEGRVSDLSALVLISPVEDSSGIRLASALPPIAPRLPILLTCGDRDAASITVVKAAQPTIERHLKSKVTYFDTNVHGNRLLSFVPKVPTAIAKYLDDPVKGRVLEWEPRYLLSPVAYQSEGILKTPAATKKAAEPAKKADTPKKDDN